MKRLFLWPLSSCLLLGGAYLYYIETSQAANVASIPDPKTLKLLERSAPSAQDCERYGFSQPEALDDELIEMSGIAPSQIYQDLFYHVRDSGNDPLLILTDGKGKVLGRLPFADSIADPEDLSYGPCPWGGASCIFVADTGDNFGWRSTGQIYAVEEQSIFQGPLRTQKLTFRYDNSKSVDVEAMTIERATGDFFLFSKEKKKTRVFKLPPAAWKDEKNAVASFMTEMPVGSVSGASMSDDGKRLLLISWRGVYEYSDRASGPWFSKKRFIDIPHLEQLEAVTYTTDQKTFVFSSERRKKKRPWGMITASCKN